MYSLMKTNSVWSLQHVHCIINIFLKSFLAHLSQWLKWAFLIKICPLSVIVVVVVLNFSHFHLLLRNHWANFNQTWHKAYLGKGDSILIEWRPWPFSKGRKLQNSENTLTKLKNLLLQNHWANFNHTWHKASLGGGDSSLFKWRALSFSKGR